MPPWLSVSGVVKRYGPTTALNGVEFKVWPGEIVALVGANGSGKSTLTKIITGVIRPDEGRIQIQGAQTTFLSPCQAHDVGIRAAYQELSLFGELSIEANIWMGHEVGRTNHDLDFDAMRKETTALLAYFQGLMRPVDTGTLVKKLTPDERQIIEFLKAFSAKPKVLILDEVTASLDARQVEKVFELARSLKASGLSVVMITHRLAEIFQLCDRAVVLRNGSIVGNRDIKSAKSDDLVRLMVGDAVKMAASFYQQTSNANKSATPVLEAEVAVWSKLPPIRFTLHAGEVLGLGGLQGHGQREVLLSVFGLRGQTARLQLGERSVRLRNVGDAVAAGIALVPGDRNREGNIAVHSILDNALLTTWRKFRFGPFLRVDAARQAADALMKRLRLKAGSLEEPVSSLSGGNAQKVVIGKWLMAAPKILLLDDPTKGVDVNAKKEFYSLLMELRAQGLAVLFFSSDDDELTTLCDRVLVMYEGQVSSELTHAQLDRKRLIAAAIRG